MGSDCSCTDDCIYVCICICVPMFMCICMCLSVSSSVHPSFHPSVLQIIHPFIILPPIPQFSYHPSTHLFPSNHTCIHPSTHQSVVIYLSHCISICLLGHLVLHPTIHPNSPKSIDPPTCTHTQKPHTPIP